MKTQILLSFIIFNVLFASSLGNLKTQNFSGERTESEIELKKTLAEQSENYFQQFNFQLTNFIFNQQVLVAKPRFIKIRNSNIQVFRHSSSAILINAPPFIA